MRAVIQGLSRSALLLAFVVLTTSSKAGVIRLEFGGVLYGGAGIGSDPGARFSGTISFDPDAAVLTANTNWNQTYNLGQTSGFSLQIAGRTVYSLSGGVRFGRADYPANYGGAASEQSILTFSSEDVSDKAFLVELRSTKGWVSPFTLPRSFLASDFDNNNFDFSQNPGGKDLYFGTIDALRVVPEPRFSTLLCMLAVGCFTLRVRR